jgi:hypothetical protein
MAQRVFFLNTLRDGVDPAGYEEWIRRVDYPVARRQESIQRYDVTRLEGMVGGEGAPPYQYLEVIDITDIDAYRSGMDGNPEFEQLLADWSKFVGESIAVYGENID